MLAIGTTITLLAPPGTEQLLVPCGGSTSLWWLLQTQVAIEIDTFVNKG